LEGDFDSSLGPHIKNMATSHVSYVLTNWENGIFDAMNHGPFIAQKASETLRASLECMGASVQILSVTIRLDREVETALRAAMPTTPAHQTAEFPPGSQVWVTWSNGQRYLGVVRQQQNGQSLIVFSNNAEHWVPNNCISAQ
jgi:hypothetical protein